MTILNTIEITTINNLVWLAVSLILMLGGYVVILLSMDNGSREYIGRVIGVLACFVGVVSMAIAATASHEYKTGEIHYEAILDESVSARAILEEYEIMEIRGEIFTLKPLDVAAEDKP